MPLQNLRPILGFYQMLVALPLLCLLLFHHLLFLVLPIKLEVMLTVLQAASVVVELKAHSKLSHVGS